MSFRTISVIGLGYIGLPTAAMFASKNIQVIGVDVNQIAIDTINRGDIHIVEPELKQLVSSAVTEGYLKATNIPEVADAFLIAVPTPFKSGSHATPEPDLSYIKSCAKSLSLVLKTGDLVILESTSPVGTTEQLAQWLSELRPDLRFPGAKGNDTVDVNVAYCPERVLPGHVVRELVENDRIIGGLTPECSERAISLYKLFVEGECIATTARTAEMAKLTENSCRDVQIAFANELSMICDELAIDVWELISLANRHPRINILQPGPGVGGHCIAVDPWFIVSKTPELAKLIHLARNVNDSKPGWVIEKLKIAIADCLEAEPGKRAKDVNIACLGLSFKANIDDLRESPALNIAAQISDFHRGKVFAVEPNISVLPDYIRDKMLLTPLAEAVSEADIILVLVDHDEFKNISIEADKLIIDTKGILKRK